MTPDPLDPAEIASFRRIQDLARKGCGANCLCKVPDAMTTPLQIEDYQ